MDELINYLRQGTASPGSHGEESGIYNFQDEYPAVHDSSWPLTPMVNDSSEGKRLDRADGENIDFLELSPTALEKFLDQSEENVLDPSNWKQDDSVQQDSIVDGKHEENAVQVPGEALRVDEYIPNKEPTLKSVHFDLENELRSSSQSPTQTVQSETLQKDIIPNWYVDRTEKLPPRSPKESDVVPMSPSESSCHDYFHTVKLQSPKKGRSPRTLSENTQELFIGQRDQLSNVIQRDVAFENVLKSNISSPSVVKPEQVLKERDDTRVNAFLQTHQSKNLDTTKSPGHVPGTQKRFCSEIGREVSLLNYYDFPPGIQALILKQMRAGHQVIELPDKGCWEGDKSRNVKTSPQHPQAVIQNRVEDKYLKTGQKTSADRPSDMTSKRETQRMQDMKNHGGDTTGVRHKKQSSVDVAVTSADDASKKSEYGHIHQASSLLQEAAMAAGLFDVNDDGDNQGSGRTDSDADQEDHPSVALQSVIADNDKNQIRTEEQEVKIQTKSGESGEFETKSENTMDGHLKKADVMSHGMDENDFEDMQNVLEYFSSEELSGQESERRQTFVSDLETKISSSSGDIFCENILDYSLPSTASNSKGECSFHSLSQGSSPGYQSAVETQEAVKEDGKCALDTMDYLNSLMGNEESKPINMDVEKSTVSQIHCQGDTFKKTVDAEDEEDDPDAIDYLNSLLNNEGLDHSGMEEGKSITFHGDDNKETLDDDIKCETAAALDYLYNVVGNSEPELTDMEEGQSNKHQTGDNCKERVINDRCYENPDVMNYLNSPIGNQEKLDVPEAVLQEAFFQETVDNCSQEDGLTSLDYLNNLLENQGSKPSHLENGQSYVPETTCQDDKYKKTQEFIDQQEGAVDHLNGFVEHHVSHISDMEEGKSKSKASFAVSNEDKGTTDSGGREGSDSLDSLDRLIENQGYQPPDVSEETSNVPLAACEENNHKEPRNNGGQEDSNYLNTVPGADPSDLEEQRSNVKSPLTIFSVSEKDVYACIQTTDIRENDKEVFHASAVYPNHSYEGVASPVTSTETRLRGGRTNEVATTEHQVDPEDMTLLERRKLKDGDTGRSVDGEQARGFISYSKDDLPTPESNSSICIVDQLPSYDQEPGTSEYECPDYLDRLITGTVPTPCSTSVPAEHGVNCIDATSEYFNDGSAESEQCIQATGEGILTASLPSGVSVEQTCSDSSTLEHIESGDTLTLRNTNDAIGEVSRGSDWSDVGSIGGLPRNEESDVKNSYQELKESEFNVPSAKQPSPTELDEATYFLNELNKQLASFK